ncbi:MAG: hypothetical protein LBK22_04055 [Tannerella sp.]|jgi:hypothetical protein|nr:hypothetical protein [Tannerella sp.]
MNDEKKRLPAAFAAKELFIIHIPGDGKMNVCSGAEPVIIRMAPLKKSYPRAINPLEMSLYST